MSIDSIKEFFSELLFDLHTEHIVEKYGADNVLHFLGGAAGALFFTCLFGGVMGALLSIGIVMCGELYKEYAMDSEPSMSDAKATLYGALVSIPAAILGAIL